jgi:hypothetical protein
MGKNGRIKKSLFIVLFLAFTASTGFQIHLVFAVVPEVLSIEPWTSGADTILNITVTHAQFGGSHYVNRVEVDVNGTIQNIDLTSQSAVTFVVPYNMGEVTENPMVKARAHCTFHGWSGWSESVEVPEFSPIHLLLVLAIVSFAVLLLRSKIASSKKSAGKVSTSYSA